MFRGDVLIMVEGAIARTKLNDRLNRSNHIVYKYGGLLLSQLRRVFEMMEHESRRAKSVHPGR